MLVLGPRETEQSLKRSRLRENALRPTQSWKFCALHNLGKADNYLNQSYSPAPVRRHAIPRTDEYVKLKIPETRPAKRRVCSFSVAFRASGVVVIGCLGGRRPIFRILLNDRRVMGRRRIVKIHLHGRRRPQDID